MRRIRTAMHRYGEPDFDASYLEWGFHDQKTQLAEAESVLGLLQASRPLRILDVACGLGTHAVHWARSGHVVTGLDISPTFLSKAQATARREGVSVHFLVQDVRTLVCQEAFDVVTWIEGSFSDLDVLRRIGRCLCSGGPFIFDVRNPEHPRTQARNADWRTWREENGVFYLERHETDPLTGRHEDAWVTIDPDKDVIEEKINVGSKVREIQDVLKDLRVAGFRDVQLRTLNGDLFQGGKEPYWLWVVAMR